jgi:hypothetical protein
MTKLRGVLFVIALLALGGCADDAGITSGAVVTGVSTRWALQSVDGRGLPTSQQVSVEATAEVVAARLTLEPDGTWVYRYDHRAFSQGQEFVTSSGATGIYETMPGESVTLRMLDAETQETFVATYTNGQFEVTMRGQTLRFGRAQ